MTISLCAAWFYAANVTGTASRVLVNGVYLEDMVLSVNSITGSGLRRELASIEIKKTALNSPKIVGTPYLNLNIKRLELVFNLKKQAIASDKDLVAVHSVQIQQPYGADIFIGANRVFDFFDSSKLSKDSPRAPIAGAEGGNVLTSVDEISSLNHFKTLFIALIFFFFSFLLSKSIEWRNIPAISDMTPDSRLAAQDEFGTINGLRGLAALLVLLSHTAPGFKALGVGLALLFVISGFLLTKPFVLSANRIFSFDNIRKYFVKRMRRILPMYYLFIFMTYVVSLQFETAMRHFLFVQAEGHLWPMTQIFAFYLILPFIILATSLLARIHNLVPVIVLLIAGAIWLESMTTWTPFYNGYYFHEFFAYSFLFGVAASYFHYGCLDNLKATLKHKTSTALLSVVGIALLALTIAWSAPIAPPKLIAPYISQFYVKSLLCAAIIIIALNCYSSWYTKLLNISLLRSVGVIGFSFYLLHGLGIKIATHLHTQFQGASNVDERSWSLFLVSFIATYLLSILAYSFVERPFFRSTKT